MKVKSIAVFTIFLLLPLLSFTSELNWAFEWNVSDDYSFDTLIIGRTTDIVTSPWVDGVYEGYNNAQVVADIELRSGRNQQRGKVEIADFGSNPEYYYYMEVRGSNGTSVYGYSGLYSSDYVSYAMTGVTSFEKWMVTSFQPVPEPSSGLLLLIGGALVGLRRKRRVA